MIRKFSKFGFFGSISKSAPEYAGVRFRNIQLSLGIHKVGVIILMRTTGPTSKTSLTLAGRLIGFTEFFGSTVTGRKGCEIGITRYKGKTAVTRTKRLFGSTPATL